jgi:predicted amidohydrolase
VTHPSSLRVALGEYDTAWHDPETSLARATDLVREARESGADLVLLPEMCTTGFTMDAAQHCEPIDGPSVRRLRELAQSASIHVIAGVATRANDGATERFYNSSLLISPDGEILAEYRKQRLFAYAREEETYAAGSESCVVTVKGVRIGLLICFDLRFPELFSAIAPRCDAIAVIANWPSTRHTHWETLLHARAIDTQTFMMGVNRLGKAGRLEYLGGSIIRDPWGEVVAASDGSKLAIGTVDPERVGSIRAKFPLVQDERAQAS